MPFDDLNDQQREVVETIDRPVLVMAPVGTGKTRVLTLRAAHAVEGGIEAESILCLSFTNKAAREMRERLVELFGKPAGAITTQTFHGLCASILRTEAETLGLDGDFLIYDEEDSTEIWGRIIRKYRLPIDLRELTRWTFLLNTAAQKARLSPYDDAEPRKAQPVFEEVLNQSRLRWTGRPPKIEFARLLADYVVELRENHAVDFTDLILGVNRLWDESEHALRRWQKRFTWVQVDEVQDTSRAEYRVLRKLADVHRQMSFLGDVDQTIYGWRGSAPFEILDDYRAVFHPREIHLTRNYRSTRAILQACTALIRCCPHAATKEIIAQQAEEGEPVRIEEAVSPRAEAEWIASRIRGLRRQHELRWSDFAVLTRTNFTARDISEIFTALKIPHIQVEQQKFFQRAEIKAAIAHLRLIESRHDGNSLMRFLKIPPKGIGEATMAALAGAPREAGLKTSDLLDPITLETADPFAPLLDAYDRGQVIVFDTETTGLDPAADDIVEIAAVRCGKTGAPERFHEFLRPSRPVGDSVNVHGWTDEFLEANGSAPEQVLGRFSEFCAGAVLVGHNVFNFDVPIIAANSARAGILGWPQAPVFDTLDITRRFHRLRRYRLADVAEALQLAKRPTHRAMEDVESTVELLEKLLARVRDGAQARRAAVQDVASRFIPLSKQLQKWRSRIEEERPYELLERVLEESGLREYYRQEKDGEPRLQHLSELKTLLERYDNPALPPRAAFVQAINLASLGSDVERQAGQEDRVLILTVHQAKGLEFDTVFVANAHDEEFPNFRSQREGRLDEEHRLFYVALSRARRRLFITWPKRDAMGNKRIPSRYIDSLR